MSTRFALVLVTVLLGALVNTTLSHGGGRPDPPPDWPLDVNLRNNLDDGVRSDGQAQWCVPPLDPVLGTQYCSGLQNVWWVIQASGSPGNLQADMNEDASIDGQRRLILDFGAANTQADLNATAYPFGPSTTLELDTYIATLGENFSNTDPSLMTMPASPAAGSVVNKRMRIAWVTGNIRYHLRWDNAPGRSFIAFTCQVSTGSACSAWTAEPALGSKAGLYGTPIKGKPSEVHYGDFRMPFSIELERQ